jgi:NUMOD3 motif
MNNKKFYVYEHWRTDRGECFYVGKGHGCRAYDMRRGRNRWHKFLQAKLSHLGTAIEIKIVADGLTEREAFDMEIERIAFWRNDGADLCNLTLGGDGPSGRKHSEEWKRANSERMKGRRPSAETRAKMSAAAMGNKKGLGKKKTTEAIEKTASYWRGRPKSDAMCQKISISKRGQVRMHTAEEDAKASARQKGIPKSEETRRRMSMHRKSDAHKQKLREINLGKTHNEETRRRLSEIAKADWARRKAQKASEIKE